jgi:spore maturation protein SpmB
VKRLLSRIGVPAAIGVCLAAILVSSSCSSPIAVATFAASAQKAVDQGPVIFADLPNSCERREAGRRSDSEILVDPTATVPLRCAGFLSRRDALVKASGVLADYFEVLGQVASFGTSALGSTASANAQQLETEANLSDHGGLSALAGILVQAATEGYQRKRLAEHIKAANTPIQNLTLAFAQIAVDDYQNDLLLNEERTLRERYGDFAERPAGRNDPVVFLLRARWQEDIGELVQRRAAVAAYVLALENIRKGHQELADQARKLDSRQLATALAPFTTSLQSVASSIHVLR